MIEESDAAVIGMSPGNSYFTLETIEKLFRLATDRYERVFVLIPDVPAIATYVALGYPENRARRDKAIPKGNALRNKSEEVIKAIGAESITIIDWSKDVAEHEIYKKYRDVTQKLFEDSESFKRDVMGTTQTALSQEEDAKPPTQESILKGTAYLLDELGFMLAAPEMFDVKKIDYIYHRPWQVYEQLIGGTYDHAPKSRLGFQIYA